MNLYSSNRAKTILEKRSRDRETGVSLIEMLIYIALFAVIAIMTVTIITNTLNSTSRFTAGSTTQTQVNQAASIIQRDLSLATTVTSATPTSITFTTRQNNTPFSVSIFSYIPGQTTVFPDGVDKTKLPTTSAIIEVRTATGGTPGQTILVTGYDATGYNGKPLFSYYDATNKELTFTTDSTQNDRNNAVRIEYHIAAIAAGRASEIQIESSVTPAYSLPPGVQADSLLSVVPQCPANFSSTIVARDTNATLHWNAPAGATSYTVYRYNESNGDTLEKSQIIPNPDTTSYVDTGLAWGTTYRYAIQASGPGGTTAQCATDYATVVPQQISFTNINSVQQSLTAVKNGSNAETLTGPSINNIPVSSVSTTNIQDGNRYTVARNLTNQLAWNQTFGTTDFNIYRQGGTTPVANIKSGTLYWDDTTPNYGDTTSYVIRAENAGGESFASAAVKLISPPAASTFNWSTPDTSTRSTTTDNVIAVNKLAPNTTGFRTQRVTTTAASASCSLAGDQSDLNFPITDNSVPSNNGVTDSGVAWGSYTCYDFIPVNDAGNGVDTTVDKVIDQPGKFTIGNVTSTQYQWIDTGVALPSGAQCWVTNIGTTRAPCDVSQGMSYTNKFAVGLFGSVNNQRTNINVVWNKAANAYNDYTVTLKATASGNTQDQGAAATPSNTATGTASYVSGAQSINFKNQMPGTAYSITVTGKAANGLTRTSTNTATTVTSPDIPSSLDNGFQTRSPSQGNYQRIKVYGNTNVIRGMVSQVGLVAISPNGKNETLFNAGSGVQTIYSPEFTYGSHSEYAYSRLSYNGSVTYSATIGRNGSVTPGCTYSCGTSFGDLPERYPVYYAGAHYRYNAGGSAAATATEAGNTNALPSPNAPVAPQDDGSSDGASYNCSTISEDDPNFTTNDGCDYGTGIPVAPTNVSASLAGTKATVTWTAAKNVNSYNVYVTTNGTTSSQNVPSGTTATFTMSPGTTSTIVVRSVNAANESPDSNKVTLTLSGTPVATPSNLQVTTQSGQTSTIAWSTVSDATGYKITAVRSGTTYTYTTTNTSYQLSTPYGSSTSVTVQSLRNSDISDPTNPLVINMPLPAPAAPASLTADDSLGSTGVTPSTLSWPAVTCTAGTAQYNLVTTAPTSTTVQSWGTATSVGVSNTANTSYTYSVAARCTDGTNYSANSASTSTTFTARYNTPSAPTSAPAPTTSAPYVTGNDVILNLPNTACASGTTTNYTVYLNGTAVGTSTSSTYTVSAPASGTYSYTYAVSCTSGGYTTPVSPASPAYSLVVSNRLAAPSNLTVSNIRGNKVTITWSAVSGSTGYNVGVNSGTGTDLLDTTTTATSYVFDKSSWANTYNFTFTVSGIDKTTSSTPINGYQSNVNAVTPQSTIYTSAPVKFTGTGTWSSQNAASTLTSPDGHYSFVMQADGNAVVYDNTASTSTAIANSRTSGNTGYYISFQSDGNFVLYTSAGKAVSGKNSGTSGSGSYLAMQSDGNLVLYNSANKALWYSKNTSQTFIY